MAIAFSACVRERQASSARKLGAADTLAVPTTSAPAPSRSGAVYYGVDSSGQGWLLYLDFEHGEGVRYAPLENVGLCDVRRDLSGTVSWTSTPVLEIVETFEGQVKPGALAGVVTFTRTATGQIARRFEVILDSTSLPASADDTLSQLYSAVSYVERAGDLTGAEILVLRERKDSLLLITMYEGVPSGPDAFTDLQWVGDTLSGAYGSPRPFHISFIRDGSSLRDRWGRVLRKQTGLRGPLLAKPRTSCKRGGDLH